MGWDKIVHRDGTVRDMDLAGQRVLGWAGRDRLVAVDGTDEDATVRVMSAADGTVREVFP
jgi:hypothetical protein